MADETRLTEAFQDALERLERGQSLEDCLQAHPDVADGLRRLLQTVEAAQRISPPPSEMVAMRRRMDTRIDALIEDTNFKPGGWRLPRGSITLLAAALLIVVVGLMLALSDGDENVASGDTTTPTVMPSLTPEVTDEPTATDEPTSTPTDEPTATDEPSATPTDDPTATDEPSATPTDEPSAIITEEAIAPPPAATEDLDDSSDDCPDAPDDWEEYRVRSGDTLSFIAAQSGTTTDELQRVNCIEDARFIIVGQRIAVPFLWSTSSDDDDDFDDDDDRDDDFDDDDDSDDDDSDDDDSDDDDFDDDDSDDDDSDDDEPDDD